jgi:2-keto-3-deoxy-L-rhamnonate aldolase RhmA
VPQLYQLTGTDSLRGLSKTNPLKAALAAGRVQIGTWINLVRNPAVLTLLQAAGLDYARVDMEHSSPSIETVADMAVLARALDEAERWIAAGVKIIACSSDAAILRGGYATAVARLRPRA